MLYTKENNEYILSCVVSDGDIYKATQNHWGEYFELTTAQEVIDTYKFQCLAHKVTPFTETIPTVTKEDLRTLFTKETPLIPKDQFLKLIRVFLHFADLHLEAGAMLLYSPEHGYKFVIGKHSVVSGGFCSTGGKDWPFVDLEGNPTTIKDSLENGYTIVGRFHSHHSMAPIPSGIDDKDEIGKGLLLCCITGNVKKNPFTRETTWENKLSLASPHGRVFVNEQDYIEPYDIYEIEHTYPEGIPQIIIDYISAGLVPTYPYSSSILAPTEPTYSWLPKPKAKSKKSSNLSLSTLLDDLSPATLVRLKEEIEKKLCESNYLL